MTQQTTERKTLATPDLAAEHARQRFQGHMARQALAARLAGHAMCPLRPDVTTLHGGDVYAVTWLETGGFDTLASTAIYEVSVVRHRDGQRTEFRVIRKERRRKSDGHVKVRYDSPAGAFDLHDDVQAALVALAAQGTRPGVAA